MNFNCNLLVKSFKKENFQFFHDSAPFPLGEGLGMGLVFHTFTPEF